MCVCVCVRMCKQARACMCVCVHVLARERLCMYTRASAHIVRAYGTCGRNTIQNYI